MTQILDVSPVAICAGVATHDYGAVAAALRLAGSAPARRLATLDALAIDAQLEGKRERAATKQEIVAALDEIASQLPGADANRLRGAFKNSGQVSREDLCWSTSTMFKGIGRMRDTRAAAKVARLIARYP